MMDSYKVGYSVDALDDLREIYSYWPDAFLSCGSNQFSYG